MNSLNVYALAHVHRLKRLRAPQGAWDFCRRVIGQGHGL